MVGLGFSALAMGNRGLLNRAAHRAVGLDAGVGAMTHTAAVGFAAQKMIKSAGAVGLAVFLRHGKRRGHAPCAVAAACLLTASASFVAMGVLLGAALLVLAVTGQLTGWWLAAGVAFAVYALVLAPTRRADRPQPAGRALGVAGRATPPPPDPWGTHRDRSDAQFPTALLDAVADARTRPRAMRKLMLHAVLSKLLGALALAAAIIAVGLPITAAGALVIYATALAASLLTIVPGGIGTVEASTTALLIGAGATAGSGGAGGRLVPACSTSGCRCSRARRSHAATRVASVAAPRRSRRVLRRRSRPPRALGVSRLARLTARLLTARRPAYWIEVANNWS